MSRTRRKAIGFGVRPEAEAAWWRLSAALADAEDAGTPLPCLLLSGRPHASDDAADRREAEEACLSCPVLEECRTFGVANREPFGVWGGLDLGPKSMAVSA